MRKDFKNWINWPDKRTVIIAEVGINHGGDEALAWEMILAAHENGADFIKLQTYSTERFFHPSLPYFDATKSMELSPEATSRLFKKAKVAAAKLITTPFDFESVDLIENFSPPLYKIASMDNDNSPLIRYIAQKGHPVIISCGMASVEEIQKLIHVVEKTGNDKLILLHCVSDYPASPESLNLEMIPYLSNLFNIPVGFSDHSIGMDGAYLAASMGAVAIEKHFTTDRNLVKKFPNADHEISFEPGELKELRMFCEKIPSMKGIAPRKITAGETIGRKNFKRGVYAKKPIKKGEPLTRDNTILLRPVGEIPAGFWDQITGKIAEKSIGNMEPIRFSDIGLPNNLRN